MLFADPQNQEPGHSSTVLRLPTVAGWLWRRRLCVSLLQPSCNRNNTNININSNNNINNENAFQPGLGAWGASLSSPGRLALSDLIGARNRQMMNVRQDHLVNTMLTTSLTLTFPGATGYIHLQSICRVRLVAGWVTFLHGRVLQRCSAVDTRHTVSVASSGLPSTISVTGSTA